MTALHGWLILDKPVGIGSTQCVSRVKRALREGGYEKIKVGHGGTLDPLASGVLPIALGEATKLAGRMLDSDKVYDFTIQFGTETDTLDAEGEVTAESDVRPSLEAVMAVLPDFTGPIEQIPPKYSALKIDGKRAYDLARAGVDVEMKTREVEIYSLSLLLFSGGAGGGGSRRQSTDPIAPTPNPSPKEEGLNSVTLTATVSKGTYIRSLARDIARALGTFGHVTMLRRTKAGPFSLKHAISLDKLNEIGKGADIKDTLLPLEAGLDDIPAFDLTPDQAGLLRRGMTLNQQDLTGSPVIAGLSLATEDKLPVALVEPSDPNDGTIKVVRGFNL